MKRGYKQMKAVKRIILISIFIILISPILSFAQSNVRASDIIDSINRKQNVIL
jgi:hypothetical protein